MEHFFYLERELFDVFLQGYYRGITEVLCVISLQFIGFNKHSIEIWNINTHPGEKCSWVPRFHRPNTKLDTFLNPSPPGDS